MKKETMKKIKLLLTIAILLLFVWFLIVSPMMTFHKNEDKLEAAGKRYFEMNPSMLPTGERVKTVTLATLYHQSYIQGDIYIPYTHKTCSVENSWVKVRKENNIYQYYTYLECGVLSSTVDHKGPDVQLKGSKEMTVDRGTPFKDPGIKSIVDNTDGKMQTSEVVVKGNVDTSTVGEYEVSYTAFDSMSNKTVVTRKVTVVQRLYSTIKLALKDTSNFVGDPGDNYVLFSNMLFRVYGVDTDKNVVLVSDEDIANVNFTKIDKWLDYFYEHLNEKSQKMIVEKKYCNMNLTDTTLDTTQCNGYTKEMKVYIPSIIEINSADANGNNFMKPYTLSWTANAKSKTDAYVVRNMYFGEDANKKYVTYPTTNNYGVRPMLTIKGDTLITGGSGSRDNPYVFGDNPKAKGGDYVNTRFTGEYITIGGFIYRIIEVDKDGTTKVISYDTVGDSEDVLVYPNAEKEKITYNPKDKTSVAYYINNRLGEYIDTSYFVNHEFKVPVYKDKIIYGGEKKTETYKAKLRAPDMYEMFAAQPQKDSFCFSYWLVNTSEKNRITGAISEIGVPLHEEIPQYASLNVRVVGHLKKGTVISSGNGTFDRPYNIK